VPPVGFEPKISAGERPQTYALDLAATGTGMLTFMQVDAMDTVTGSAVNYLKDHPLEV
jgi:hypothetical protein